MSKLAHSNDETMEQIERNNRDDTRPKEPPLGITKFPVRSKPIRRELLIRYEKCPQCGHDLDTGWECMECAFDALEEFPELPKRIEERKST